MSGHEDAGEPRRYKPQYTSHHPIPTIKKYREEQEARRAGADADGHEEPELDAAKEAEKREGVLEWQAVDGHQQQAAGAQQNNIPDGDGGDHGDHGEGAQPAKDTSEADVGSTDPKQRRKDIKKGRESEAEREVTDPVTHLPVRIRDLTSKALKEVPENHEPFGATIQSSTGLSNKKKSENQLKTESKELQYGYDAMQTLFPPPDFENIKQELAKTQSLGIVFGVTGAALMIVIAIGLQKLLNVDRLSSTLTQHENLRLVLKIAVQLAFVIAIGAGIWALTLVVQDWSSKRIKTIWDDHIWAAHADSSYENSKSHHTESVVWLNSLLGSVWPLVNPDLFTSLADTLEDVMQASLPRMVQMVSVNDIGQGSESLRILGVRWLPTGAAARAVSDDGSLKKPADLEQSNGTSKSNGGVETGSQGQDKRELGEDGSQQQVPEAMEAEEGDFVNVEVAFAYRARSKKSSIKDRAKDMHLYIAFYLPGNIKVPVWVDLRGLVGTMRMRLQLCPDPPFFSLCTITFLGQPKVDISCTPLSKHALNIMDVPLISNFVQSAVDAAMAEYVAPKSLSLDLKDMLAGDDFKKDTNAYGVVVVHIQRGYDFKSGDTGIPLLKDGSSDPYVSVGWAKFGKPVWSTRLLLNEMEPWWDETAYILVTQEEIDVNERLRLQLWDSDRMTADDDLGRIELDLREVMRNDESNGQMWHRTDGFRALKAGETMPGKLEWSIGYYSKTRITNDQLQKQTFDTNIRSLDAMKEKVDQICERKLREADTKEGRHKHAADELSQQKQQELKSMEDAMVISAPPPDGYPSGIFSIQIHQITGLELEKLSKVENDKVKQGSEEEEEGEGLPSAYCTILINHNKIFKTRTKPKNAKPFFNAGTERYIADWRNTEVYISVRDARATEDDPLLGIVHLPLGEMFKERSQINSFYPLTGGIGFGRVRLSMVCRSVQLQAPPEAIGWEYGTVDVQSNVTAVDLPDDLKHLKLKFYSDLGSGKMYASKEDSGWKTKNDQSLKLPVHKRYSSCLAIQFRRHGMFHDQTPAFAIFWLKNIPDEKEQEITLTVWKGDVDRASKSAIPECGEKVGSIKLNLTFWGGLGAAHSKWASKDQNLRDVVEVLETARDNYEAMENEKEVGIVDGNATDSSSDESDAASHIHSSRPNGSKAPPDKLKGYKKHQDELNRHNRGLMQWRLPRTARWAAHKIDRTESRFSGMFKHHTRQSGVETEV